MNKFINFVIQWREVWLTNFMIFGTQRFNVTSWTELIQFLVSYDEILALE